MAITVDVTGNPFVITGTTASNSKVTDSVVEIQAIVWFGSPTDGHKVSVKDKAGNQLWKATQVVNLVKHNEDIIFPLGLMSNDGIYIDDMDSGELYIYIK